MMSLKFFNHNRVPGQKLCDIITVIIIINNNNNKAKVEKYPRISIRKMKDIHAGKIDINSSRFNYFS